MGLFMRSLSKATDVDAVMETYQTNMRKPEILKQLQSMPSTIDQDFRTEIFTLLARSAQAAAAFAGFAGVFITMLVYTAGLFKNKHCTGNAHLQT